eukprot:TRINITY_DN66838_c6_g15_i1.p1 TRINITY_DN66838_c6_g15~~TRINITY_DN66838_c6_g15_i1.p1  ORF type:complete len:508 (-),score=20.13 TRINITY_DN66838_c6_g15_i1:150-1673(-)
MPKVSSLPALRQAYAHLQRATQKVNIQLQQGSLSGVVDPRQVYVFREVHMKNVEAFGFDYDYTLAAYKPELQSAIYQMALTHLIQQMKYPEDLAHWKYDPSFPIRGLHFDYNKGYLLKLDAYRQVALDCVYYGRSPVQPTDVLEHYGGTNVSTSYMQRSMFQLNDTFSLPEACLIADVTEYLKAKGLAFEPRFVCDDVRNSVTAVHLSGKLHKHIMDNLPQYLDPNPDVVEFLQEVRKQGIELFIVTNSGYHFVDTGMRHLLGTGRSNDWRDLFRVIVCNARKPHWYTGRAPFRWLNTTSGSSWGPGNVTHLQPGEVYQQGCIRNFVQMTGLEGAKVLYIGDHVSNDLKEATDLQGWQTAAILQEVENEIEVQNGIDFRSKLQQQVDLEHLIRVLQFHAEDDATKELLFDWKQERNGYRTELKECFNKQFGSVFRAPVGASYFSWKVQESAALYTSRVENLGLYGDLQDITFYPYRQYLPHERPRKSLLPPELVNALLAPQPTPAGV